MKRRAVTETAELRRGTTTCAFSDCVYPALLQARQRKAYMLLRNIGGSKEIFSPILISLLWLLPTARCETKNNTVLLRTQVCVEMAVSSVLKASCLLRTRIEMALFLSLWGKQR